jgi:predicted lipoprotein with Yx(FWY)xxD motif
MVVVLAVALSALFAAAPVSAAEPYPYPYPAPPAPESPAPAPSDPYPPPSGDPYPTPPPPMPPSPEPAPEGSAKPVRVKQTAVDGRMILTNSRGRTLYSLSAERNGRFICTDSCLSLWKPLRVPAGAKPVGPVKLGTIERPEGGLQATFRGKPLYTFVQDRKRGDTKGDGFRDVGVWHPATVGKAGG